MNELQMFRQYLETEREACLTQATALKQDSRNDEANLMKVRANIFSIVVSVSHTAEKQAPENPFAFIQDKIKSIPQAWENSLLAAEKHQDNETITIERMKLNTISEISKKLTLIFTNG